MLKGKTIICFSSVDWDFVWLVNQEIMSRFAQNGNKVLFVENTGLRSVAFKDLPRFKKRIKNWLKGNLGIRKEKENLFIYSPIILPFPYFKLARWLNKLLMVLIIKKWMRTQKIYRSIVWTFLPSPLALDVIDKLDKSLLIYYCTDSFVNTNGSKFAEKIKITEAALFKKSDLIFVTSRKLYTYCRQYNEKVYLFPSGVDFEYFQDVSLNRKHIPEDISSIKKPIIGYVGTLHKWIDIELIKHIADNIKNCSLVFIGPKAVQLDGLSRYKNIYFLGAKTHKELPYYIKAFDICIIPYLITEYTNYVYPTKLNEYLALGKPVVSTNLPEIENFNKEEGELVDIGRTSHEFVEKINRVLSGTVDDQIEKRTSVAKTNSWTIKFQQMSNLIETFFKVKDI